VFPSVTTVLSILDQGWLKDWKDRLGGEVATKVKKEINIDDSIYNSIVKHSGTKTSGVISGRSASIGTKAHKLIEDYLNNKKLDPFAELYPMSHFRNIQTEVDKIDRIRVLEANLYSEKLGIAGRVDCIADYKGEYAVIDFKTSSKMKDDISSYTLQLTAYALMWNELQKTNIKLGIIIMSSADGQSKVFKINIDDHIEKLKETIELYKQQNQT
jgi:genome maintenance exonuclease 1